MWKMGNASLDANDGGASLDGGDGGASLDGVVGVTLRLIGEIGALYRY